MNADSAFLDTNVLLHLLSNDTAKAERAENLLRERAAVSVQVLNEFVAVARRKTQLSFGDIRDSLLVIRSFCTVRPPDIETHEHALDICERFGLSIYDSLIVAAASHSGCRRLWTEDMQDGQIIDGVMIANPFKP